MYMKTLILSSVSAAFLVACGGGEPTTTPQSSSSATDQAAQSAVTEAVDEVAGGDVRIVGSSTVYPFSTKVAQEFGNKTSFKVVVESTGSGGGHKLFCEGIGSSTPDVTNSSRRQKKSEFDQCAENGVEEIVEVKIGFDGIVVANAIDAPAIDMGLKDIYLAFAKDVPMSDADCTMKPNPYTKWSEINPSLPDFTIEAFGPPPTSGTRDAFVEIGMEGGAKAVPCMADLRKADKKAFAKLAHTLREDGKWIDGGENDNALVQTLVNTPTAIGVFGFSFLDQNTDKIKGASIDGAPAEFESIASGDYPISRSLFFYIKKGNVGITPGLQEFALEFTSDEASGPGGYLEEIGLIPLPDAERAQYRANVESLVTYSQ